MHPQLAIRPQRRRTGDQPPGRKSPQHLRLILRDGQRHHFVLQAGKQPAVGIDRRGIQQRMPGRFGSASSPGTSTSNVRVFGGSNLAGSGGFGFRGFVLGFEIGLFGNLKRLPAGIAKRIRAEVFLILDFDLVFRETAMGGTVSVKVISKSMPVAYGCSKMRYSYSSQSWG